MPDAPRATPEAPREADRFLVPPPATPGDPASSEFNLSALPTDASDAAVDKNAAKELTAACVRDLADLQERFYADGSRAMLIVLQAIDAGGKDSTVRRCFGGINPAGVRVWSFKQPTNLERRHDFLWRHHQRCPAKGMIAVHNRSHYEAVLVERVGKLTPEAVWRPRHAQIAAFEQMLVAEGTIVLKFFLHLSRSEQAERFRDRLRRPDKWWKFSEADLAERERWQEYQAAFRDALAATSAPAAPWYAIPADQKWYRDWLITAVVREALAAAGSRYPSPPSDMATRVDEFIERLDAGGDPGLR